MNTSISDHKKSTPNSSLFVSQQGENLKRIFLQLSKNSENENSEEWIQKIKKSHTQKEYIPKFS